MNAHTSIAATWSAFCRQSAAAPLPPTVAARAQLCLADHLHAAMHGARSATGDLLRRYLEPRGNAVGAETYALYAGAMSAVHEIDDVHQDTSLHPGSVIGAAALAAAEESGASGTVVLAAIAVGYEIAVRLAIAAGHRHYHYFHATATCGGVGAAAAAAVVLDLDQDQTGHAIAVAATSASGLWEGINDEAVTIKHLHPGLAAERGLRAVRLARLGLRGADLAIEGGKGFLAALAQAGPHAPDENPLRASLDAILVDGLSERWAIERNIFKRYPFCLGCFEPLEGLRHVIDSTRRSPEEVASVRVETSPPTAWMVGQPDPQDPFQAKFSAPYALALVLAGHDVERAPLPDALLFDPAVRRFVPRVRVEAQPEIQRRRARVTVEWKDGAHDCGDRPFRNLAEPEVWARFHRACDQYLGARGAILERQIEAFGDLDDVRELTPLVRDAVAL